jgi:hypothetical protein
MLACGAGAADYHAAPRARAGGDGSARRPWQLSRALAAADTVKPGDTVWLHGGVYTGQFVCTLNGAEGKPIVIRPYRGQRVTLDARGAGTAALLVNGAWTTFRDLEITDTDPDRVRERPHGMFVRGPHTTIVNMVIHDCGVGIGFWTDCAPPAEIYGCIIYNNGWQGPAPDRGHGHAIYAQNRDGVKRLVDNIFFNQFGYGIHAYGSSRAFLKGFHIEGNTGFNNGSLSRGREMTSNILVGGGAPAANIVLTENLSYFDKPAPGFRLGFGPVNDDVEAGGNYVVGILQVDKWRKTRFAGNTVVSPGPLARLDVAGDGSAHEWRRNSYFSRNPVFAVTEGGKTAELDFAAWQERIGSDRDSAVHPEPPSGTRVFVRPNRYQPGRAHIAVFNWDRRDAVEADLSQVLAPGRKFEIRYAQDYFGAPALRGKCVGKPVRIPMRAHPPAPPIGRVPSPLVTTGPVFDVFVVVPARN